MFSHVLKLHFELPAVYRTVVGLIFGVIANQIIKIVEPLFVALLVSMRGMTKHITGRKGLTWYWENLSGTLTCKLCFDLTMKLK